MSAPVRVAIIEDNDVFREALEMLLGLQPGLEVVASAPDGDNAATLCREHSPDVLLMDYRLPGMDGVQATRLLLEACPEVVVVGLTASANQSEVEALLRPGPWPASPRTSRSRTSSRPSTASPRSRLAVVQLDAGNTVVLDSTADFPEGPERWPNWRVVPLYVRFGADSYRDYVDLGPAEFYARLREATELPTTSQPTPADFAAAYEDLAGYERIYSLHIPRKLSGTWQSAATRRSKSAEIACG